MIKQIALFIICSIISAFCSASAWACSPARLPPRIDKSIEAQPPLTETSCLQELSTAHRTNAHFRFRNQCAQTMKVQSIDCEGNHCIDVEVEPNNYFDVSNDAIEYSSTHKLTWSVADQTGSITLLVDVYPSNRFDASGCTNDDSVCTHATISTNTSSRHPTYALMLLLCLVWLRTKKQTL